MRERASGGSLESPRADRPNQLWVSRMHSGKYCYGKTPLQTFIENATLAYDKQLDRIKPTSGPVARKTLEYFLLMSAANE